MDRNFHSYKGTQTGEANVTLNNSDAVNPNFTPILPGIYKIEVNNMAASLNTVAAINV